MPIFEAIKLALAQIRVQKLKSFFTLIGVAIGVMFLIAIVSIVDGVGRYMEDDLVGKLITKNSFEAASAPEHPDRRRGRERMALVAQPAAAHRRRHSRRRRGVAAERAMVDLRAGST